MNDLDREKCIDAMSFILETETPLEVKEYAWRKMLDLIAQRPPEYVRKMERERGLRNG